MPLRVTSTRLASSKEAGTLDPDEEKPIDNEKERNRLTEEMIKLMEESDAPIELFQRLGLK